MTSELEDAIAKVIAGNPAAFEIVVKATSARLLRMSARLLGDITAAEDVVQEAYLRAFEALRTGSFQEQSRPETWLYRITVNAAIDARRKRKRAREEGNDIAMNEAPSLSVRSAEVHVALRELGDVLGELPEDQAAILIMKTMEGMTGKEIADVLECSEGAVEQKLVRARAALRKRRIP